MTDPDLVYVSKLLAQGKISGPVLEMGTGWDGRSCRTLIESMGTEYFGTDMAPGQGVDFVADFETGKGVDEIRGRTHLFGTVLLLNVLEHVFDPIRVLDNASSLLQPGGRVVVIAPAVWPLHGFPIDCCRLLPDWYRRYADSRSLELEGDSFEWIGLGPIASYRNADGSECMPPPASDRSGFRIWSRLVHRTFRTFGRSASFPSHLAIGVSLRRLEGPVLCHVEPSNRRDPSPP